MEHMAADVVAGVIASMQAIGATQGVIGVKAKKKAAVEAVQAATKGTPVRVQLLGDYYPAGDEYDLVYAVTQRLIPPQGIPLNVGVVVNNVETLANIAAANRGEPVIRKTVTLAGAMKKPVSLTVPVGTTYREAIEAAGGLTTDDPVLLIGGLMMGRTSENLDTPITKTDTGAVILPRHHHVIERKLKPAQVQAHIGKSACDQCRYCTEFCPRYLLGYQVEPHQVMRSLAFTATDAQYWNQLAMNCCSCGLCTLYACPEELFPKEACDSSKAAMKAANLKWTGKAPTKPHGMYDGRRVPIKSLAQKLDVLAYDVPAPLENLRIEPRRVTLMLKQGAGVANRPLVKTGDRVKAGQQIGEIPEGQLGAIIHASVDGIVKEVGNDRIVIERTA
jgi:Na+-translocating ferredoxin:NAD+ oxidoreductase RnfC subunit